MRDIRRPEATEGVVERLTDPRYTETEVPVFSTIMELLIFAAGVGLKTGNHVPVPASGKTVPYRVFENNQKEAYIFLVGLAASGEPQVLTGNNDDDICRSFEEYAAGGLEEIGRWLSANPQDASGVETLIAKMQSVVSAVAEQTPVPSPV